MAKDAYFARLIASLDGLDDDIRVRLAERLSDEIALVSLRRRARPPITAAATVNSVVPQAAAAPALPDEPTGPTTSDFDPYSPNVVVVIRTRGREAVLEELHSIGDIDCLRLLAREQQLGVAPDLDDPADVRLAIVAAAERRIANRRAAAS